jgi:hypothetical protein
MRPNRPLPMLPSQIYRYAATRTMPQRSSRLESPGGIAPPFGFSLCVRSAPDERMICAYPRSGECRCCCQWGVCVCRKLESNFRYTQVKPSRFRRLALSNCSHGRIYSAPIASSLVLISGLSCKTTFNKELWTSSFPLYSIKPNLRNLFMKKLTRDLVVPIISASVS